tara:strand:- start:4158 stop:4361 length:204 start_codon:yes stop_codon:yes gene_type:complete
MNDKKLIETIWNDMVLRRRFENNPYSLSCDELELLRNQEQFDDIVNWDKTSTHEKLLNNLTMAGYKH